MSSAKNFTEPSAKPATTPDRWALRAEARGHDVSEKPYDKGRREKKMGIEVGKLAARATA